MSNKRIDFFFYISTIWTWQENILKKYENQDEPAYINLGFCRKYWKQYTHIINTPIAHSNQKSSSLSLNNWPQLVWTNEQPKWKIKFQTKHG